MKPQGSGVPGIVPYQAFHANDGWIVIGGGNDGLFAENGGSAGSASARADARFAANASRSRIVTSSSAAAEEIGGHSVGEVRELMDAAGVPNAPVQRIDEVVHDQHAKALGIIQSGPEGALPTVGLPLRLRWREARV